jgi:hypothetical protein
MGTGITPFSELQVAGDKGRRLLIAFRAQLMEVFIWGGPPGLQAEVIHNQQRYPCQGLEPALVAAGRPGGMEGAEELAWGGEAPLIALLNGTMAEGLSEGGFAGAAGTGE